MIRDYNIANDAAISPFKIMGLDPQFCIGDTFYVAKKTSAAWQWFRDRVPHDKLFINLDNALNACTANRGDKILVAPNHTETVTGAGAITLDKAGVTVQGLGRYDARPTFLLDGAAASMLVTAANCTFDNIVLNTGHADLAYCMLITAKGFRLSNCVIGEITTDENWVDAIHVSAADNDADGLEIIGNEIRMVDAASVTAIDLLKNINDAKIMYNRISGDFDATPFAPIYMATAEVPLNIMVIGNLIHNVHNADAAVGISMDCTTATGWIMYNHVYGLDVAGETPILTGATGLYCSQNYYTYQGTLSGFEFPAIGTLS